MSRLSRSIWSLPAPWGAAVLLLAHVLLVLRVEPAVTWFYPIVWWSYILIVDTAVFVRRGTSLFLSERDEFWMIAALSFPVWLVFEFLNFTLRNWYYASASPILAYRILGQVVSFSTVMPLLFITADALATTPLFQRYTSRPRRLSPLTSAGSVLIGILLVTLSLTRPQAYFPLVWGAFIFLLDPINRHFGFPSILRDIEKGIWRRILLLLAAGLLAGLLWEVWNFWADTKWIYTVPVLGALKVFEMPLLGFLGFPPFAVECYVIYNFVCLLRGRVPWRLDDARPGPTLIPISRFLGISSLAATSVFCITLVAGIEYVTVDSVRPGLDAAQRLVRTPPGALESFSIRTPDDLLCMGNTPEGRDRLAIALGMSSEGLVAWLSAVDLMRFKGVGEEHFLQLREQGVFKVSDLRHRQPEELTKRMLETYQRQTTIQVPPELRKTEVWIRASRRHHDRTSTDNG